MHGTTVRKFRVFWAWQDEKEEAWLREMSQQGLHLTTPLFPCVYTFVSGEPRDDAYRLDYVTRASREEYREYLQVFSDSGWEHLGQMAGWQYFRKPVASDEAPEIFTDPDSKLEKYRRLLGWLFILLPMMVVLLTSTGRRTDSALGVSVSCFQAAIVTLLGYGLLRIALRIRQLRRL